MDSATIILLFALIGAILGNVLWIANYLRVIGSDIRAIKREQERHARSW